MIAAVIIGLACIGALVASRRGGFMHLLVWGLVAVYVAAGALWRFDLLAMLPMIELPVAMAAYGRAAWTGRTRDALLCAVVVSRLPLHLVADALPYSTYAHLLNASFVAALAVASWNRGMSDAIGTCLHWVRGLRVRVAARGGALAALAR